MSIVSEISIEPWLEELWLRGGSDLLLVGGSAPRLRVSGKLEPIEGSVVLTGEQIHLLALGLLTEQQKSVLMEFLDVDFSFSWGARARVRGSVFTQRGEAALALRIIPAEIPTFEQLSLPSAAEMLIKQPRGFVLVTGPTGSGKSTTLAAIINRINETRPAHILTIEDPVEYVHHHKMSVVSQREVGLDSPSFDRALRSALREDPDVLLIGEMRDLESIQIALTMAETGHLVFATLHTNDAPQAIDRIIDVFPPERQEQTRVQIASSLNTVIAQRLVPKIGGGMVAAFEVLVATSPVRNLIREGRASQLPNIMFTSSKDLMQTLETDLARLVSEGKISFEDAMDVTGRPKELIRLLEQIGVSLGKG